MKKVSIVRLNRKNSRPGARPFHSLLYTSMLSNVSILQSSGHQEVMMTPQDFLRSITPGIQQPEHKGLDQFTNITKEDINSLGKAFGVEETSIFHQLGAGG